MGGREVPWILIGGGDSLQIEVVQGLVKEDTPVHALNALQSRKTVEGHHGRLEPGSGSKPSGTYAKQC